jgi:hypothetical protein
MHYYIYMIWATIVMINQDKTLTNHNKMFIISSLQKGPRSFTVFVAS